MADFLFGLNYYGDPNKKQTLADLIGSGSAFNREQATDFANAFKFNNIDQLVGATGQQALQYARQTSPFVSTQNQANGLLGGQLPIQNFQIPQTATYSSDMFSNLRGFSDIQNLLQQNTEQTNRLAGLQTPSTEEQAFQQQLINLRAEADKLRLGTEAGRQAIDQKVIPRQVQVGQKQALAEQAQLEGNTLAAREANLLQSLGLAQQARQSQINAESIKQQGTQFGIGVAQNLLNTDINLRINAANVMAQQQKDYFDRIDKLDAQAQTRLDTVLNLYQGMTFDQLPDQSKLQLQTLAAQVGIPIDAITQGLKLAKDKLDYDNLTKNKPITQTVDGNLLQYNPQTQSWEVIYSSGGELPEIVRVNGVDYLQNPDGSYSLLDVPQTPEQIAAQNSAIVNLKNKITTIDELLGSSGFDQAVGPFKITRLFSSMPNAQNFIAGVEQLISQETIDTLLNLKKAGGTLGALSDQERMLLRNAASKIGFWSITKNGKVVGYKASEKDFKAELEKIKDLAQTALNNAGGQENPNNILQNFYNKNQGQRQYIDQLEGEGKTPEDILQILGISFNAVAPDTKTGMRTDRHNNPTAFTTDIAKLAELKEGIDYVRGDPFSGGRYYTAKLLGNPVDQTIKVIDKIGFYTQSGKPRWTHTVIPQSQWDRMTYEQKKQVVKQMYQREGNKGALNQYFG